MDLADHIRSKARSLGFSYCGYAKAESLESLQPLYETFLSERDFTGMNYLERYSEQRLRPELLLPGVKSVIALLLNYNPASRIPETGNYRISTYGYGGKYPPLLKERMSSLVELITSMDRGSRSRTFADSGPVLEKYWAVQSGVGWQGKNTLVIHPEGGSFFFIGIIFTTLELEPDEPVKDRCGTCTRCVEACPTNALHTPYRLDIRRCLAYQTLKDRGEVPAEIRGRFNNWIFGCDTCQDVCPFNRKAAPHTEPHFQMLPALMELRKPDWQAMTEEDFQRIFRQSEIRRTGLQILKRNMGLADEGIVNQRP